MRMKSALSLALAGTLLFATAGILPAAEEVPPVDAELNDLSVANALGGRSVLQRIRSAPTVTAQRVDTPQDAATVEEALHVIALGEPFPLSQEDATTLRNILTRSSSYLASSKRCVFRANVRFAFSGEGAPLALVICFGCGELQVWDNDKLTSFSPVDPAYAELLSLTRKLFPDDRFFDRFNAETFWKEKPEPER